MNRQIGDRAVVLGASMAGLLAARVLADSYGQVTVIDRDELPETPTHRRGVPHGRHLHALAARGQQALEELFPGLTAELVAHGAPAGDLLTDARFYLSGHRLRQAHTGLMLLCASRPLLEGHVRARVRALPNVRFLDRCDVVGSGHHPGWPPRHRGAGAAPGRRQRRGAAGRRPGGRRQRPWLAHPGMAGRARLPPAGAGGGADRAGLRHPDLPAAARRPRRRPGDPRRRDARSIRGPGPSSGSKAIGGC